MAHNSERFCFSYTLVDGLPAARSFPCSFVSFSFFLRTDFEQELELLVLDAQGG